MALASPFVIVLETGERARLEELAASRTAPTGPVQRATAVLACAKGCRTLRYGGGLQQLQVTPGLRVLARTPLLCAGHCQLWRTVR